MMFAVPAVVTSEAGTLAINWVALMKLVASSVPFHKTAEPVLKLEPNTVSRNACEFGGTDAGFNEEMAGALSETIGNGSVFEVPAAALFTEIVAEPALAINGAATVAVSCVGPP